MTPLARRTRLTGHPPRCRWCGRIVHPASSPAFERCCPRCARRRPPAPYPFLAWALGWPVRPGGEGAS